MHVLVLYITEEWRWGGGWCLFQVVFLFVLMFFFFFFFLIFMYTSDIISCLLVLIVLIAFIVRLVKTRRISQNLQYNQYTTI